MDMGSCSSRDIFTLQVTDDTMEPEFEQGRLIVIDPAGYVRHKSFVIANVNEEWIFRQIFIRNGEYELRALKEDQETHNIAGLDEIEGVIIQQAGRRRKDRRFYPPRETS